MGPNRRAQDRDERASVGRASPLVLSHDWSGHRSRTALAKVLLPCLRSVGLGRSADIGPSTRRSDIEHDPFPTTPLKRPQPSPTSTRGTRLMETCLSNFLPSIQHLAAERVSSVVVLYDALFFQERRRIAALIEGARLPAIFGARDHAARVVPYPDSAQVTAL